METTENTTNELILRIEEKYPKMSKGQRRLADYVCKNYDKAVFLTAAKLGETVGVSESTVVRFAIQLGYKGYPGFQKALEELVRNKLNSIQRMEVTYGRISQSEILETVLHSDIEKIKQTLSVIDHKAFDLAIDTILGAKRIYVIGIRSCAPLAANQAQSLTKDKDIIVIPTKTVPQGITAVISFMPEADVDTNMDAMLEAVKNVKTGQVTYAVRDTHIDDKEIHEGDIMGIGDDGILSVGQSVEETAKEMLAKLVDDDSELISLYYGQDVLAEDAEKFAGDVEALYPDVDVDIHMGGQPIYYYVLSVE